MKKLFGGMSYFFTALMVIGYLALHACYAYTAFTMFKFWFALFVTVIPIGGDMALVGACIGFGNWWPAIAFGIYAVIYMLASTFASAADKAKE